MKIYTKIINKITVKAYRDGSEWIVQAGDMSAYPFPTNKFTMTRAMEFMAETASREVYE